MDIDRRFVFIDSDDVTLPLRLFFRRCFFLFGCGLLRARRSGSKYGSRKYQGKQSQPNFHCILPVGIVVDSGPTTMG